ncbi:preprotein translocase subunit YajC [Rubripirellula lacrimiformis]|uniref:Sec translocon accessory complex subunit YajC n=1 Tax=Rubripirellula lacrimiformis TaxID=1930273 RepID=A0A517NFD6_9BACT|nr:preprotein translocase subunit YajC [Rubripirellula lacrimiformis]QDT05849.1 preprotein translocase subunit YajC [Rubripirellula lacrimiformis]
MFFVGALNLFLVDLQLLAQADAAAGDAAVADPGTGSSGDFLSPFLLPAGLLFLFYFIVIAPERKKKAAEANLMSSLKKNDRVVTIGGIHGVIAAVSADNDVVTLRIDESGNTRIKVNRSAISRIVTDKETSGKENSSDKSKDDGSAAKK